MKTTLYIIRHCEALGNIREVFQGSTDSDITEKGALQLKKLKERCKEIPFDIIYTSHLIRAKKTAEAVNFYHGVPIITEPDFTEIDGGDMEGEKWIDLPALFPDTYPIWHTDIGNYKAPNGESFREVYRRVKNALLKVIADNKGKTVGIISHGCAIYNMLVFLHGFSEDELSENPFWCDNCSVSRVDITDNKFVPVFINDAKHIVNNEKTAPHIMLWRTDLTNFEKNT